MTNKELIDKIRNEILHLKLKELQRTNGVNTGADVYLSSYAVLSILSNALTDEIEDERIRKWLADYFSSIKKTVWVHRDITCEQILDWLEKQKEQKPISQADFDAAKHEALWDEQKPAWSEEDADILNCCISSIEEAKENRYAYKETDGDTSYDREIAWLKSLRPSWKPSEEQMNALNFVITYMFSTKANPTVLRDLYNDLLKLK